MYPLQTHVHVPDRAAYEEASILITQFGEHAAMEAAMRADKSRSVGNVIHFCRWRQIQRTIAMLNGEDVSATVH